MRQQASIKITACSVIKQILIFGKVYWYLPKLNTLMSNVNKMVKHTLKILQQMLQNLYRVFDFFVNTELKWTTEYLSRLISNTLMSRNINLILDRIYNNDFPFCKMKTIVQFTIAIYFSF